jgi:hypothetical protein
MRTEPNSVTSCNFYVFKNEASTTALRSETSLHRPIKPRGLRKRRGLTRDRNRPENNRLRRIGNNHETIIIRHGTLRIQSRRKHRHVTRPSRQHATRGHPTRRPEHNTDSCLRTPTSPCRSPPKTLFRFHRPTGGNMTNDPTRLPADLAKDGIAAATPSFAFYGRVSTEDNQDPESSRNWQLPSPTI